MKLDLTRWREALVRFEAELKHLKSQRRQPRDPGESFNYAPLLLAKAEVTRLYCLRRHLKGKLHATGRLWCVRSASGRAYVQVHPTTDLATQEALVRSIDGWMASFVVQEEAVEQPAAPTTG
ncbi:MAG: hypothetical protein INH37_26645 [Myxococcaceae bacterium]|jgi:hypothetical protein|nr:hypothetical protein [Myxococcaceae bacterium]